MPRRAIDAQRDYGVGTGGDDGALMSALSKDAPYGARITMPWTMNLATTWKVGPGCEDIVFDWERDPRQGRVDEAVRWSGPAGGYMIDMRESSFVRFKGPCMVKGTAARALNIDGYETHISSECALEDAYIAADQITPTDRVIAFSEIAHQNNEYMALKRVKIEAPGGCGPYPYAVTTAKESNVIAGDSVRQLTPNMRVRLYDVGPSGRGIDTRVVSVDLTGKTPVAVLADKVKLARDRTPALFGESIGTLVWCGPNPNAHQTHLQQVNLVRGAFAVDFGNGGFIYDRVRLTDCEVGTYVRSLTQPCEARNSRAEFCRQLIRNESGVPIKNIAFAMDLAVVAPDSNYVDNTGPGVIEFDTFTLENNAMASPSCRFVSSDQGQKISLRLGKLADRSTWTQLARICGETTLGRSHASVFLVAPILPDLPGASFDTFTTFGANPLPGDEDIGAGQGIIGWDDQHQDLCVMIKRADGTVVRQRLVSR